MKHIVQPEDLHSLTSAERLLVVHVDPAFLEPVLGKEVLFFNKLSDLAATENVATVIAQVDSPLSDALLKQNHLHLIFADRPRYGHRILHVAPSYVWGFWYLDEIGLNANSSMRLRTFSETEVDWGHAEWFWNGVTSYMLDNNVSRSKQQGRIRTRLDASFAAIFCQEIEDRSPPEHYLSTEDMILNTARACEGGKVYVKPHPNQTKEGWAKIERACENDPNLILTDASVHDLVLVSDWVVTQNSAAGFEALMQKKPVVTCARSDYHHATKVARSGDELRDILRAGPDDLAEFPYEKYFYWFMAQHCLEPQHDDFAQRAWDRIREKAML